MLEQSLPCRRLVWSSPASDSSGCAGWAFLLTWVVFESFWGRLVAILVGLVFGRPLGWLRPNSSSGLACSSASRPGP